MFGDAAAFASVIELLAAGSHASSVDAVVGVEARGFIVGAPVAAQLGVGFVPVRKPGHLPRAVESQSYELEYGTDLLEIHRDAISPGQRVLVVDDVLATGGTAAATVRLVERLGGSVTALSFVLELDALGGRARLAPLPVTSVLSYA